jgi:hypothetical protein
MRASMLSSFKEFLTADNVLPLVENLDSDAIVDAGTVRMSRVSRDKTEYLGTLNFHHARMSNSSSKPASFNASAKYSSSSDFTVSEVFFLCMKSFSPAFISLTLLDAPQVCPLNQEKK